MIAAPVLLPPERWLAWRDAIESRTLAVVASSERSEASSVAASMANSAWTTSAAAMAALALGFGFRLRESRSGSRSVASLASFVPALVLLWLGAGGSEDPSDSIALGVTLLAPLLLARVRSDWCWNGTASAWWNAARVTGAGLVAVACFALANATDADGLVLRLPDVDKLWLYPAWALLQQLMLIEIIAPRTRAVCRSDLDAALLAGALFGALHLPNFGLMLATFVAGTAWTLLGYRHRALLPVAASHAVLGLLLVALAPSWLLRSAEIGGRYLMPP